ncbi:MAG: hypothetical protein KAV00_06920 [Phycisphaerae bacterium]|nr:hypothetical protein [Phycisphaerae bacterium]
MLPPSVIICGLIVQVVPSVRACERGDYGEYLERRSEIVICPNLSDVTQGKTFVHEVLECINVEMGLDLDEKTLRSLDTGIFQFLRSNRRHIEAIMNGSQMVK